MDELGAATREISSWQHKTDARPRRSARRPTEPYTLPPLDATIGDCPSRVHEPSPSSVATEACRLWQQTAFERRRMQLPQAKTSLSVRFFFCKLGSDLVRMDERRSAVADKVTRRTASRWTL